MCLQFEAFENTVGKGEIARDEQFLLFPQFFEPVWRTFCDFHQTSELSSATLSFWNSRKLVIWERVKLGLCDKTLSFIYF